MKDPKRFYTYAYLREDRTPYYIGKGEGRRVYRKERRVRPPKDKSRIIFLKKNLLEKEAFNHEIYMIAVFGRKDLRTGILHNMTDGGDGTSGAIRSEETKMKMRGKNNPNYGKSRSEETKKRIGDSNRGKTPSEETRKKQSKSHQGHSPTEETRKKLSEAKSGENNPFYGKKHSEKTRRKQSEVRIGKYGGENHYFYGKKHSEETRRKQSEVKKGKNNPNYGKKWWNNGIECKKSENCPGEGWVLGRKLK